MTGQRPQDTPNLNNFDFRTIFSVNASTENSSFMFFRSCSIGIHKILFCFTARFAAAVKEWP